MDASLTLSKGWLAMVFFNERSMGHSEVEGLRSVGRARNTQNLAEAVGNPVDNNLWQSTADIHAGDDALNGAAGIALQTDLSSDQRRRRLKFLSDLHGGQVGLQIGVCLQRAELDHLGQHVLVRHRIQRILRRHLRHQQVEKILLRHHLGRHRKRVVGRTRRRAGGGGFGS